MISGAEELRSLVHAFTRRFGLLDQSKTPCGKPIAVSEAHTLMQLLENPGIGQAELSNCLGLSESAISRLLAHLEQRGLIKRKKKECDGRARCLHLTSKGERMASEINQSSLALFDTILSALPEAKLGQLFESLTILAEAIPLSFPGPKGNAE
jgi:DNA-binding MarR family transcriptional regulator